MKNVIEKSAFYTDQNLKRQIIGLEEMMTELEGDNKKAMERLRVPPMREHIEEDVNINAILITLGMELSFILCCVIVAALLITFGELEIDYVATINLFR